jgi:hypothetical protein
MSDWDGDIKNVSHILTEGQIVKLVAMTDALRDDLDLLDQVVSIKRSVSEEDYEYALGLWEDLDEVEQTALWVAPRYGGIFTTEERKRLRP